MEQEIWRCISDYDGLYQVSSYGRVKMMGRYKRLWHGAKTFIQPRILNQFTVCGYKKVKLRSKDGATKMVSVHRLVAESFIPNPQNLPQVNHKDENKTNNCVDNLEWCTPEYNTNYGTGIERCSKAKCKRVVQMSLDGHIVREWESMKSIVNETSFSYSRISQACNKEPNKAYGFIWKFI